MEKKTATGSVSQVVEEDMKFNKEKAIEEFHKMIDTLNFEGYHLDAIQLDLRFADWLAQDIECPRCKGTGKIVSHCYDCHGKGTIPTVMRYIE